MARYGYAWVALEEPIATIPELPEFGAPGWRTIFQFYEPWGTSPLRVLENSCDNAHFSFGHRATFGVAATPEPSTGCCATTAKKTARRGCSSTSTTSSRAKTKTCSKPPTRMP